MAAYDYESSDVFEAEDAKIIARNAVNAAVGNENIVYNRDKVNMWCGQIIDHCIKELAKLNKKVKYAVTCIIMQRNGAGLQTAAGAFWQRDADGLISVQMQTATFDCVVTIFGTII